MFNLFKTSRHSGGVLAAGLALLLAGAVLPSAAAATVALSPYHAPPWLISPGRPLTLAYALLGESVTGDAGSPILHQDRQAKSAPLAAPLIASALVQRLRRSITVSSEEAGGAERVGLGAGEDAGGGGTLTAGDRAAAGDQSPHRGTACGQRRAAALSPPCARLAARPARARPAPARR